MEKCSTHFDEAMADESYMNEKQLSYFKNKLIVQKLELVEKMSLQREKLKNLKATQSDIIDRSNFLIELEREVKTQERYSIVLRQINQALEKIDRGEFGYCESTGHPIGLRRLEVLPFATMSVKAMENYA